LKKERREKSRIKIVNACSYPPFLLECNRGAVGLSIVIAEIPGTGDNSSVALDKYVLQPLL
jgi:hypothetical protein